MNTTPSSDRVIIHSICAAHLNTPQRLLRLQQMLASWRQQKNHLPSLSISLSHNLPTRPIIDRQHYDRDGKLSITQQPGPTRQGHHYRHLMSSIPNNSWVMFTDDDDIWSPTRTATLAHVLANLPTTTNAVLIPCHAQHPRIPDLDRRVCIHAATALGTAVNVCSAADVDRCIRQGTLSLSHALPLGVGCYWAYAVQSKALKHFFEV